MSRVCPTRIQQPAQSANESSTWTNAVASDEIEIPQLVSEVTVDIVCIRDALMDNGSAFTMLNSTLYDRLHSKPAIQQFKNRAPDIVGVVGASAKVRGYVDIPLLIAGVEIAHSLLVVSELSFPILIVMDILQPHAATLPLGNSSTIQLNTEFVMYDSSSKLSRFANIEVRIISPAPLKLL